jgi:hypothetical protein
MGMVHRAVKLMEVSRAAPPRQAEQRDGEQRQLRRADVSEQDGHSVYHDVSSALF